MQIPEFIAEVTAEIRKGALRANTVFAGPITFNLALNDNGQLISRNNTHEAHRVSFAIFPRPPAPAPEP